MGRRLKEPVEKECLKCGSKFTTIQSTKKYCSTKCSFSRLWTTKQRREKSISQRKFMTGDSDQAEEARLRVLKNKKLPPIIPSPYERRLEEHEFSDGEVLWKDDTPGFDWEGYFGWK